MIAVISLQKYKKNSINSIVKHRFVGFSKIFRMIIVQNQHEIQTAIHQLKSTNTNATVGFVPTMGALHEGHVSLIELARKKADIVVCSIFVNPTQFNNAADLATYPRTEEADAKLLADNKCDILLLPNVDDVYPKGVAEYTIDLGGLDEVMEGEFRPGHFNGVCMVVERFFEMVKPDMAFFGQKDFQQLSILRRMVKIRKLPVNVIGAPIRRNERGLALSSRNMLLSKQEREEASLIYRALLGGLVRYEQTNKADVIALTIASFFEESKLKPEYIAIVNNETLQPVEVVNENCTVCVAVYCGNVRLIDNMPFADFAEV